ncbi:MAG TPA: hypothetical protein VGW74_09380 [Propionibacteriaceae bacterium]|nr:hypothetical protein [Propionibacteriaceae bacterium]
MDETTNGTSTWDTLTVTVARNGRRSECMFATTDGFTTTSEAEVERHLVESYGMGRLDAVALVMGRKRLAAW